METPTEYSPLLWSLPICVLGGQAKGWAAMRPCLSGETLAFRVVRLRDIWDAHGLLATELTNGGQNE